MTNVPIGEDFAATIRNYAGHVRSFSPGARRFLIASVLGGINAGVASVLLSLFLLARVGDEAALGQLLGLGSIGAACGAVLGGPLADRLGPWRALIGGTVISGSGLLAVLIPGPAALVPIGTFVGGLGGVIVYVAIPPFLTTVANASTRPFLFGVAGACYVTSTAIGSVLGGLLPAVLRAVLPLAAPVEIWRLALASGIACSAIGIPFLWASRITELDPPATAADEPVLVGTGVQPSVRGTDAHARADRREPGTLDAGDYGEEQTSDGSVLDGTVGITVKRHVMIIARFLVTDGLIRLGANMVVPYFSVFFVQVLGATETWYGTLRVVERTIEVGAMLAVAPIALRFGPVATIVATQILSVPMLIGLGMAPALLPASAIFLLRGTLMEMTVPLRDNFMMDRLPSTVRATGSAVVLLSGYAIGYVGVRFGGLLNQSDHRLEAHLLAGSLYIVSAALFWLLFRGQNGTRPSAHGTTA